MLSEDHCVHVKRSTRGTMLLTRYVDHILFVRNNLEIIKGTKKLRSSVFEMKDMDEDRYIICVKIIRNLKLDKRSRELNPRVG